MSTGKRLFAGCILLPLLLFASCAAKMYIDAKMYILPGKVLESSTQPTQALDTGMQVAEALDAYVQPRFTILRDKNFGAIRIVYRKHAGIVQLKVDTPQEKALIANVNAADRDYAISLLHCTPNPPGGAYTVTPRLELLYFNQQHVASAFNYTSVMDSENIAGKNKLDWEETQKKAIAALPQLMSGREYRTGDASWDVLMRPVRASKQECLGCHTEAKSGDTLGVMVYAVRKTRRSEAVKLGMQ